jgi:hypothetical protein
MIASFLFSKEPGTFTNMKNDLVPQDRWLNNMTVEETRRFESTGEAISRDCLTKIYGKEFKNVRLKGMRNPNTGQKLEIDCYNDELKLGVEYHGINHYKYIPFFHKTREAYEKMRERDDYKLYMCKKLGINLIVVPYTTSHDKICSYLNRELTSIGMMDHINGWGEKAKYKKRTKLSKKY